MVTAKICYLGDDDLTRAAAYLGGVMLYWGLDFDHIPSAQAPDPDFLQKTYSLYIISDYPAINFSEEHMRHIANAVSAGSGLLMIGGWESFYGQSGGYEKSPLAEVLPATMQKIDDRQNCAQPCLMHKAADHEILNGLPFETPAGIGGFNRITPKPDARVVLTSVQFAVHNKQNEFHFQCQEEAPLLVLGSYGKGRTAAFATDVAPHWVGGFVDWGDKRVTQAIMNGSIEVGNWYARFWHNLLCWTGNFQSDTCDNK